MRRETMVKISIKAESPRKKEFYLPAKVILKYLLTDDDELDTMIMCKDPNIELTTSDQSLYEAIGSIAKEDNFRLNKLVKFLEVVDVVNYTSASKMQRTVLKEERVEELRKTALEKKLISGEDKNG